MASPARKIFRQLWWAPLLCFGLAAALNQTNFMRDLEWKTLDWRTNYRVNFQPQPDSRLWLVLFDDATEEEMVAWPDSRRWHGQLAQLLAAHGAKVFTLDVFMTSSRSAEDDTAMIDGFAAARQSGMEIVSGAVRSDYPTESSESDQFGPTQELTKVSGDAAGVVQSRYASLPIPELRKISHYGFVDVPKYGVERVVSSEGIPRFLPMVVRIGDVLYPSLSLATLMRYYGLGAAEVAVRFGDGIYLETKEGIKRIPIDARGCLLLNFRYEAVDATSVFSTISYRPLTLGLSSKYVEKIEGVAEPPEMKGAIVVLGLFLTGQADAAPSPRAEFSPLPLIHLNALNNILQDDYAHRVSGGIIWGTALALGYAGLFLLAGRSAVLLIAGTALGVVSYATFALWGWVAHSWWIDFVAPVTGFIGLQFVFIGRRVFDEQLAKQEIKNMFGAYLAPHLVERMVKSGEKPQLGGRQEEITAYFSDIQGYSSFSEKVSPPRLVELLNEYLTVCTDIIQEEGGTLDKYIGDAVVAMFGAPISLPDHAYRACVTALRVQHALEKLRERWTAQGETWPLSVRQMRSRIGLNTGVAVVGNMGSRTRFNYTMTSDDVNLAARMESGAKSWGTYLMCTEATKSACETHGGDRIVFRPLGRIVVKGRTHAVPIYELTALKENLTEQTRACLATFAEGLARFQARDWAGAQTCFQRSELLEPLRPGRDPGVHDNPSLVYLRLTEECRSNPPAADWNGVHVMTEK